MFCPRNSFVNSAWRAACTVLAVVTIHMCGCSRPPAETGEAKTESDTPQAIYALGHLEPADGVISISALPGDRLTQIDPDVKVNQLAPANGILGKLASYDLRLAQLKALDLKRELASKEHAAKRTQAKAQLEGAKAQLKQAEAKLKDVRLQKQRFEYLSEAAEIAKEDLAAIEELSLSDPDLVTPHQLRRQENQVTQAVVDLKIARGSYATALEAAEATYEAALVNVQAATQALAQVNAVDPARAVDEEIAIARLSLRQSILWAPGAANQAIDLESLTQLTSEEADGQYTVLEIGLQPGEFVTQMPIMQLGDLSRIACIAEVYEADIQNIRVGQQATITSPAFDAELPELKGTVKQIARMVAGPNLQSRNPLAPVDRSVMQVRIDLNDTTPAMLEEARQRLGLQVTVTFLKPN